jgi:Family of unknown function (DUF6326)
MKSMTSKQGAELADERVNVKVVLSGLWIAMLFVFAYVDIFAFYRADVINGALSAKVAGPGFAINQTFLALTTLYIVFPSLMVVFSLLAPARLNRRVNLVMSGLYTLTIVGSMVGETWIYYLLGSAVEIVLLGAVARVAWTWKLRDHAPLRSAA